MAMNSFYMGNGSGKRHGEAFITKVDKHGSKHWTDNNCPKCGGTGYLPGYEHVDGARCWKCGATGFHPHHWVERTPEYQAVLDAKRVEKARKKNLAERAEFLARNGFNEEGKTFVVIGKTFDIKEELKAAGAHFNYQYGWHFSNPNDLYPSVELTVDECFWENVLGQLHWNDNIKELVESKMPKVESVSSFVGEEGSKVEVELTLNACFSFDSQFGTSYINKFVDQAGNIFVWKTGRQVIEIGKSVKLKGTIKEHNEYKGEKQTVLTRCKEVA